MMTPRQTRSVYRGMLYACPTTVACAAALHTLLSGYVNATALTAWALGVVAASTAAWALAIAYRCLRPTPQESKPWNAIYIGMLVLVAGTLAAAPLALPAQDGLPARVLLNLSAISIALFWFAVVAVHSISSMIVMTPILLALAVRLHLNPNFPHPVTLLPLGLLTLAYFAALSFERVFKLLADARLRSRDATEQQHSAEAALAANQRDFQMLLETSVQGTLVIDRGFTPLFCNAEFARLLGYEAADDILRLKTVRSLFATADVIQLTGLGSDAGAQAQGHHRAEVHAFRRDGRTAVLEVRGVEITWHAVHAYYLAVYDITEFKATQERLQQAMKMEAVGNLTGGIAHDFNNILSVITGNIELLRAHNNAPNVGLRRIQESAERGVALTSRLLSFSRRQSLVPSAVKLSRVVGDVRALLPQALTASIIIKTQIAQDVAPVWVDAMQLQTALLNLAINARDAMPDGGTLTILCRNQDTLAKGMAGHLNADARYVEIDVTDTGTGIAPALRTQVFEPFFTTKEVGHGTGLGLSMVYGFVTQSEGHIEVLAPAAGGTTIRMTLPSARSAHSAQAIHTAPTEDVPLGEGQCIVVVEDEQSVREVAVAMVLGLGYRPLAAASAREAQALFETHSDVAVVLTDIVLGGVMNGLELAINLRACEPSARVIFMSGYAPEHVSLPAHLGAHDVFLQKPFTRAQVARALHECLLPQQMKN